MNPRVEPIEAVLNDVQLTLEELAALCAVGPQWVIERIEQGLIEVCGGDRNAWRFDATALRRVRTIRSIELTFDAAPELAALVADLTEEIARLRAALRDAERRW
jgi:chaperone modulatory protein CbpM